MRYVKPHYYGDFRCIAEKCPDTCCAGWQIVIDEEKLEEYSQVPGDFGSRLKASIDWEEGTFRQNRGRCSFLNGDNLCDLYRELGEDALCKTCSMYPRHVEEFEGLRELSLSLSCPVAARMILTCREPLVLLEEENGDPEELAEEFEDFDLLLFTQLEDARSLVMDVLKDRQTAIGGRIQWVMELAQKLQTCIDEERYYDADDVIASYRSQRQRDGGGGRIPAEQASEDRQSVGESLYARMCEEYRVLESLERLREEWSEVLYKARFVLYDNSEACYEAVRKEFDENFGEKSNHREEWSLFRENLMQFFIYTYFCGAVYDDEIYKKAALSEFCVRWICELVMARRAFALQGLQRGENDPDGGFDWELCIDTAYRFAREIEHSDDNLNLLEEWL